MKGNNLWALAMATALVFGPAVADPPPDADPAASSTPLDVDKVLCPDAKLFSEKLITDVCWSCMFPLYLGGIKIKGPSEYRPEIAADPGVACLCEGDLDKGILPVAGVPMGLNMPTYIVSVTSKPYCFPELGGFSPGQQMGLVSRYNVGDENVSQGYSEKDYHRSSFSWHLLSFPLLKLMELFEAPSCSIDGLSTIDLIWISETIPIWYDSELAAVAAPESILFANPIADALQIIDCAAASALKPIDSLFNVAGCWGSHYPLTQDVGYADDKIDLKSLTASRALFTMARIGQLKRTAGDDALCRPQKMPILQKSMYKMQQLWPMPEAESLKVDCQASEACDNGGNVGDGGPARDTDPENQNSNNLDQITINSLNKTCCHPIGQSNFFWGSWRDAGIDSHAMYLLWRWTDCCVGLL